MRWHQRLLNRTRTERQLESELRFHLEQQVADHVAAGMTPEQARRRARLEFGGLDQVKEECRDVGAARLVETLIQDVRYGLRQLRRNPGFTAVAVITLALGIGAATAIFTLINTVLLKPLPYPHAGRIVQFEVSLRRPQFQTYRISIAMAMAIARNVPVLEDCTLSNFSGPGVNLTGGPIPELVSGIHVSAPYFRLFGTPMALGRPFSGKEDVPGGPHVAVISYGLWKSRFGGNPNIVGRTIQLDGLPYVVTGVAGRSFQPVLPSEVWLPLEADPNTAFNLDNSCFGRQEKPPVL
jgi:putative ABC transport system permease protein